MLKRLRAAVPLRVSLVVATLLLVACGLTVSGIAVTSILRNSQIHRVDRNLLDATHGWALTRQPVSLSWQSPTAERPPSNFYVRSIVSGREKLVDCQRSTSRSLCCRQTTMSARSR